MTDKDLSAGLEEFGLSRYEAQAYVTLVSRGTVSAGDMAYHSGLPRTKIYPVLKKLERKGLAIISGDRPITYTPVAPADAFDPMVQEQIDRMNAMNTLVSNLKSVSDRARRSRGMEERRYFHHTAENTPDRLGGMIEGARSSIRAMTDRWGLGVLAGCREQLLRVLRRNVDVRVIVPPSQICSEAFKSLPEGVDIRASESVQNCIVFDEADLMVLDGSNGKSAVFSSAGILAAGQAGLFSHVWGGAVRTDGLSEMTGSEAQEIYRMIRIVGERALGHVLDSSMISKSRVDLLRVLDRSGIRLKDRPIDEVTEIVDSALRMVCSGRASLDAKAGNILIESRMNSGHSLPWAAILDGYLQKTGHSTRMTYQNRHAGEKIHLKFGP